MRTTLRKVGNSSGVIIPKAVLNEIGASAGDEMELSVQGKRIVIARLEPHPRAGWEEASKAIAEAGDDKLVWPEFGNLDDDCWRW